LHASLAAVKICGHAQSKIGANSNRTTVERLVMKNTKCETILDDCGAPSLMPTNMGGFNCKVSMSELSVESTYGTSMLVGSQDLHSKRHAAIRWLRAQQVLQPQFTQNVVTKGFREMCFKQGDDRIPKEMPVLT
jgi:hypothetical protein